MSSSNKLLSKNDRKSQLSVAFVMAVVARVGYTTSEPKIDRDSIDLTIDAGGSMRPKLDVQLKATSTLTWKDGYAPFVLKQKNFNDLCAPRMAPIILIVLELPKLEEEWLTCDASSLILRRAAYWFSLSGETPLDTESRTVHLTDSQRFDPESLSVMMQKARDGQKL